MPVDVEATLNSQPLDQDAHPYTACFPSGESTTVVVSGWSVATLLKAAGTTPGQVRSVSVRRAVGEGSVVLTPPDYDDAAAGAPSFPEGPALIQPRRGGADLATSYDFFRPYRKPDCASDPNGPDRVSTPPGQALSIAIASGTLLHVTAAADRDHIADGESVGLSGQVQDPPPGQQLSYRWSFTDGTSAAGPAVTHRFPGPGTWSATLSASTGPDAGGASAPVTVVVGKAAGAPGGGDGSQPTGTTGNPTASPSASASASSSPGARASSSPTASATGRPSPGASSAGAPTAGPAAPQQAGPAVAPTAGPVATTTATPAPLPSLAVLPPGLRGLGLVASPAPLAAPLAPPQVATAPTVGGEVVVQGVSVVSLRSGPATPNEVLTDTLRRSLGPGGTRPPSPALPLARVGALAMLLLCLVGGAVAELRR